MGWLRPLPFPDADRPVRIFNTYPRAGVLDDGCSLPNYYERRGRLPALAALAAYWGDTAVVTVEIVELDNGARSLPSAIAAITGPKSVGRQGEGQHPVGQLNATVAAVSLLP